MSRQSSSSSSGGIGFVGLLQVAFIVLKLMGYIDWPWVWVLSPIWIGVLLVLSIILVIGVIALVVYVVRGLLEKKTTTRHRRFL